MITVEEIEAATEKLAPSDFDRLASWISAHYHEIWKRQINRAADARSLNILFNNAVAQRGKLTDVRARVLESA